MEEFKYKRSPELQAAFERTIVNDCKVLEYLDRFAEEYKASVPYEMRPGYAFEALTQSWIMLSAYIHGHADRLGCDFGKLMGQAREEVEKEIQEKQMKKEVA